MNIELIQSQGTCSTITETPCADKSDTAFESCWPMADGYLKRVRLRPGLDLYVMDCGPGTGLKMNSPAWPSGFGFKFFISGKMRYQNTAVSQEMVMADGLNRFSFFPVSNGNGKCLSMERLNVVTVSMSPSFFFTLFRDGSLAASGLSGPFSGKAFFHIRPNTPAMETAARAIFNCAFHGSLKKIFLESKALELVTYQLHGLTPVKQGNRISGEERDKVRTAREILVRHIDAPPSFLTLSRMVGLPHNRLSLGFRAVYGMTPFTLLKDIRLEKSRILLEKNGNVTQTALDVGYASLSHFAKSFRQKYGTSPKQYQLNSRS